MMLPPATSDTRMLASLTTKHYSTKVHASDDAGQS
jgi:hypothetical protein